MQLQQARLFHEAIGLTGLVLTKLDGTAKGGIVVRIYRELGVPIKLIGVGEQAESKPFLCAELLVAIRRIYADAENHRMQLFILLNCVLTF